MLPMQRITRMPLLVSTICERLETIPDLCCPREITRCLSVVQKVSSLLLLLSPQTVQYPVSIQLIVPLSFPGRMS